jgi:AcrR family transcriptional regulator
MARARLDRATIIEAARNLLDDEGLAGFSMARLGDRLSVTAMALYRHVRDRAELETAVVEVVLDDLALEDDSEDAVATWMRRVRAHWLEHPWLGSLLGTSTSLNRSWVDALERLTVALERAGLHDEDVARELVRISRITSGIVIQEIASPLPQRGGLGDYVARYSVALDAYDNDALFEDLVVETTARVARLARTR